MKKTGSGDVVLDWVVVVAAIGLYFKTSDIMSYFSPTNLNDLFGMDVSRIYGAIMALLVEGAALALHFNHRARLSVSAQAVKWTLLAISGICQVFDGFQVTNTLAQQSSEMKMIFQYGVPLIPLLILIMVFGIGRLPEPDGSVEKIPFEGVMPMFKRLLYGSGNAPRAQKQARISTPDKKTNDSPDVPKTSVQKPPSNFTLADYLQKSGMTAGQARAKFPNFESFAADCSGRFDYISGGNMRQIYGELNPTRGDSK